MELASKGIDRNVNTYTGDFHVDSEKDDLYSVANEAGDVITFTFGKATKGKLSQLLIILVLIQLTRESTHRHNSYQYNLPNYLLVMFS